MSSTFIEHSPEAEGDKSLILIMDGEGNVTADPAHFEKLINNQKLPDMGIKIVRLDSSHGENENDGDIDSKELKLTVEEIYPENLAMAHGDPSVNMMMSPLEILPGPSNEHISHDIVDPFSQMDPEQLQRLEHALASEQAKQILGENVAAMLDMLSVDDSPAAFLQNSIKNDHCYTNLLPSSDPNGSSFFMNDNRMNNSETLKGKGKAKVGTPIKGRKIVSANAVSTGGNVVKRTIVKESPQVQRQQQIKQTNILDYGVPVGVSQLKSQEKVNDPTFEEDVDVEEDSEGSAGDDDNLSDEDYNNRSTRTKRKSRKNRKKIVVRKAAPVRPYGRPGSRFGKRSVTTPEIRARNEKLNDAMSKIVQSMDYDSRDSEDKLDLKKNVRKVTSVKGKSNKEESLVESEKAVKDVPKPSEETSSAGKTQQAKYPKRENRKPPAHLAEALGPALFSAPDIIRRISTGEEVPQTPPEKKNFTVGANSNAKLAEKRVPKTTPSKGESVVNESASNMKGKTKTSPKGSTQGAKPLRNENGEVSKVVGEYHEDKAVTPKLPSTSTEATTVNKKATLEIQKLIEKHQVKQALYEEDQDYSDENIDENYYLDPTQMDQSLLEGFSQTTSKSEEQLLQEAILLQEQLIESNKGIVLPEASNVGLDGSQVGIQFETETIEDIQNEITSAILVAQQEGPSDQKPGFQFEAIKNVFMSGSNDSGLKVINKSTENQIEKEHDDVDAREEGGLIVDESKPEDRRRNSAKRRRSDEVSDLDSDLDDALSEASWNSEDDPDRLWCICRKPHNNRFMICCDVCEEWFHGKCVGITKTIGKQMEQDGLEWSCPNCLKKKEVEEHDKETEKIKLLKEKMAQSIKDQQQKIKESQKLKNQALGGKDKSIKSPKASSSNLKQTKISDFSSGQGSEEGETGGRKCIMCKGPVRENSIYCSDDCIRKHSQHAISQLMSDGNKKSGSDSSGTGQGDVKVAQKIRKEDSRIVVMDSNSKKFLIGQNAPTAANLTSWLKENPSYHVVYKKSDKPGKILLTSRKVVKIQSKPGETQRVFLQTQKIADPVKSTQLKLAVSPNSKQINILQPSGAGVAGKKIYQIVNTTGSGRKQTAFVVKPKQTEVIDALPLSIKTVLPKTVPVKVKEATSPKVVQVPASKESALPKTEKIQRKRKEKVVKSAPASAGGKDSKMGQTSKQDEAKEKDKDKEKKDSDLQIRESVKKTLAETLKARVQECKDMEYNEEHIDGLALKIEEKLYKHFESKVDTKYKSKYRSLVFNIKDPKNETLFKKIVDNSISPKELVKLSPEELASQELARWREKENQHQLEMIKKTELELMTKGNTYIMKSHKGEQVIESDQSEKVAAVAAEIDPNTPAQELVSALNSVTSTTQDGNDDEKSKGNSETSLMKMKKREKERRRSRDRKHDRRDKERRSSSRSSRSRSHRSKDKKRSRSRDRDKDKSKYKHKDKKDENKKGKDSKEGPALAEEKSEDKLDRNEITTSDDTDDKTFKKSVDDDDADREPSSTVIIKTPDINLEEPEPPPLWKGSIVMADVAKFSGIATEISGDCGGLSIDIGEKVDVVGRIPFATVWDYIARMKKMGTKDILVIKIVPVTEEEKASYVTLYSYLWKRSRIGVIGKTSDAVKDFYLYPLASHSPLPQVLLPLDGPGFEVDEENIILGIIVRNKHRSRHIGITSAESAHHSLKSVKKMQTVVEEESSSFPETVPDRSYTPPLPDKEQDELLKKVRQKRKIRVRTEYTKTSTLADEEEEYEQEDDDSPYSPGDSDEDLPPLPKIAKPTVPGVSSSISKLLTPVTTPTDSNLQDPLEIQRKIEEMNRAIEEQTQQIQTLTSAVPKLAAGTVLPTLPLLANVTSAILPSALSPSLPVSNAAVSQPPSGAIKLSTPTEKVQLPLISSENEEEVNSPSRSFTPPLKVEENIPFLPEVTSKISLPSNLQEILASIQKKPGAEDSDLGQKEGAKSIEEMLKANNPNLSAALNALNQTKNLLSTLTNTKASDNADRSEKPAESQAILSRMTDQELLLKVREMEMEANAGNSSPGLLAMSAQGAPCPPQPLPPGIQDIPLLPPGGAFANPPPPPFLSNPLMSSSSGVEPFAKSLCDPNDRKPEKKMKLDPKSVFENEGVPDFVNIPGSSWDEKKGQKTKNYKIDIKLAMNSLERKIADGDHFDVESISKMPDIRTMDDRHLPSSSGILQANMTEEPRYSVDERILPKAEDDRDGRFRSHDRDRRRSDDREMKRDWKYDRRHWGDGRRYKGDYRKYDRRDRPKFRKDRFDDKRNRHLQKEWDGSIKNFEDRQRWRNQDMRREDMRSSRKRADSSTN